MKEYRNKRTEEGPALLCRTLSFGPVRAEEKKKLLDKKGRMFTAELLMVEEPGNPYGPVFRAVEGTVETEGGDPAAIQTERVPRPEAD